MFLQLLFLSEEVGVQRKEITKAGSDRTKTKTHLLFLLQPSGTAHLLQKRKEEEISSVGNKTPGTVGAWLYI